MSETLLRRQTKPLGVTVGTTMHVTGLGRTKVYQLIAEGKLKSVAVGRRRLVLYSSIEELLRPAA